MPPAGDSSGSAESSRIVARKWVDCGNYGSVAPRRALSLYLRLLSIVDDDLRGPKHTGWVCGFIASRRDGSVSRNNCIAHTTREYAA